MQRRGELPQEERTRRVLILIFSILGCFIAIVWGVMSLSEKKKLEEVSPLSVKKLKAKIQSISKDIRKLEDAYYTYSIPVGWAGREHGLASPITIDSSPIAGICYEVLEETLRYWQSEIEGVPEEKIKKVLTLKQIFDKIEQEIEKLKLRKKTLLVESYNNIKKYYRKLMRKGPFKKLFEKIKVKIEQSELEELSICEYLDKVCKDIEDKHQRILEHIRNKTQNFMDFVSNLSEKTERLSELETEIRELKQLVQTKKTKIEKMRKEMTEKIEREEFKLTEAKLKKEPDGKIISVDKERQIVYVDLTRKDKIIAGLKFKVFEIGRGGIKKDKGEIEIVRIGEDRSIGVITNLIDENRPIIPGDCIYDVHFVRGEPRHFAAIGFVQGKYSWESLKELIKRNGDYFDEEITEKTDYVVVGIIKYDKEHKYLINPGFEKADRLGIRMITEKHLYQYLGLPWR